MCDFDLQECKGGQDTTYFGKEGFGRERIRIFHNNLLEKTTIYSFEISNISLLIKGHMILSRGGGGFFKKKLQREKGGNIERLRGKTLDLIKR